MPNKTSLTPGDSSKSRKGPTDRGREQKFRKEAKEGRQQQRQHEAEREDHGGPQGRKDKDYQRKF